jgi:hypothetical protein
MEISGKIVQVLAEQGGTSQRGPWKKREYILETMEKYPKKVCLAVWNDDVDQFNIKLGEQVTASINIESREYNGRWYTDVKIWKLDRGNTAKPESRKAEQVPDVTTFSDDSSDDMLPF